MRPSPAVRGLLVMEGEALSLSPCGSEQKLSLVDDTGGLLRSVYQRLTSGSPEAVYVELVGRFAPAPAETPETTPAATLVVTELRRAGPVGEGSGCATAELKAEVLARGNEPFWSVTIFTDRIVFQEPENLAGTEFPASAARAERGRRVYRSERRGLGAREIEIELEARGCTDSMSGEYTHLTAVVTLDGRVLQGCAVASAAPDA